MKHAINSLVVALSLAAFSFTGSAQTTPPEPPNPPDPRATPEPPAPPEPVNVALEVENSKLKQAGAQLDKAHEALRKAEATAPKPWIFGGSTANHTLVIPKENADPKVLEDCEEDLNVMSRILEKATGGRDKGPNAMGIVVHSVFGEASTPRNLYIDGYGALFVLNVNFPLLAPAGKKPEAEPKEDTSTEWEETRRELYQSSGNFTLNWEKIVPPPSGPAEKYDAEKVEDLKRELISALKNGSHIRKLKADEAITVVVMGRGGPGEPKLVRRSSSAGSGGGSYGGPNTFTYRYGTASHPGGDTRGSKLVLRAKKEDIDAFQKDKLSLEEFRKKVTVMVY